MLKRFWLIVKIVFKICALIFGLAIYSLWMVDLYNIFVIDDNPLLAVVKSAMSIPIWEIIKNYCKDMFFLGEHAAAMIFPCMIMSIPLLRWFYMILKGGFGLSVGYMLNNISVDYVYADTGEYAFTEERPGLLVFLAIMAIKLSLIIALINISPFILIVTLPINVIQLFRIRKGGKNNE